MFRRIVYFHLMRHHSKIVLGRTPLPTLNISLVRRRTVRGLSRLPIVRRCASQVEFSNPTG